MSALDEVGGREVCGLLYLLFLLFTLTDVRDVCYSLPLLYCYQFFFVFLQCETCNPHSLSLCVRPCSKIDGLVYLEYLVLRFLFYTPDHPNDVLVYREH